MDAAAGENAVTSSACRLADNATPTVQIGDQMTMRIAGQKVAHGRVHRACPDSRQRPSARPRLPPRRCPNPSARCRPPHGSRAQSAPRVNRRYLLHQQRLRCCIDRNATSRQAPANRPPATRRRREGTCHRFGSYRRSAMADGRPKTVLRGSGNPAPDSASRPRREPVSAGRRRCRNLAVGVCRDGHC